MRRLLFAGILLALSILLATAGGGCGGTSNNNEDSGPPMLDSGDAPSDAGDATAEGSTDGPAEVGDGPSDAPHDTSEAATSFTVGGHVSGLNGSGLVLQNNGGDDLSISSDGPFTFKTPLATGGAYAVTILTQPTAPAQVCSVTLGTGKVGTANVTSVVVNCSSNAYVIGGAAYGLGGTLVLQDNGGDNLTLMASAPFAFSTPVATGKTYKVTVLTTPPGQTCTVTNGSGMVKNANITTVVVACSNQTFSIGGKVSGLTGSGLELQNNAGDTLPVSTAGAFVFSTRLVDGEPYDVTVFQQPSGQFCVVKNGTGSVAGANVTSVDVSCAVAAPYTIGGTVTGLLLGDGGVNSVVLQDNGGDNLTIDAVGPDAGAPVPFKFSKKVVQGHPYDVTVLTNPADPAEYCSVANGAGTVSSGNVNNILVSCYSAAAGGCGRFSNGFTGSWSAPAGSPLSSDVAMSAYLPAGGAGATFYVGEFLSFDSYSSTTNSYTVLGSPPTFIQSFGSLAWVTDSLWTITENAVERYNLSTGTWTSASLPGAEGGKYFSEYQTTSDNAGHLWAFSSGDTLIDYDTAAGTATYHALPTSLGTYVSFPRITFDACSGLLYITSESSPLYSYDPASGKQVLLSTPPGSFETTLGGFCGDRSGHIFTMTSGFGDGGSSTMFQYTIATKTWDSLPSGGPGSNFGSACGVGADGYLYTIEPVYFCYYCSFDSGAPSSTFKILLN